MGLVSFPTVADDEDPYLVYLRYLDTLFNPPLNVGFVPRVAVLWILTGYGIIISCVCLAVHIVECRRKNRRIWLWRLVRRSKGRYIVGNQYLLFAAMSLLTCGLSIGLTSSFFQVFVDRTHQRSAFFWRSIIWIPVGAHMWLSSYANLQASILTTQEAAGRDHLSPLVANGLYLSGFAGFFVSVLALDIVLSLAWRNTWDAQIALVKQLKDAAQSRPNATVAEILTWTRPLCRRVNARYDVVVTVARVDGALYAFCSLVVVLANIGGMALILTLRRQIRFNLDRIPAGDPAVAPVLLQDTVDSSDQPFGSALLVGEQDKMPIPLLPVLCSRAIETRYDDDADHLARPGVRRGTSLNDLKRIAAEGPHRQSAYRTQARQVLALKKIELDVWIFLAAIVALATACFAVGLWLLISPRMIFGRLSMMELAYFSVLWLYLIGTDVALTFLLLNSARVHLPRWGPPLGRRVLATQDALHRGKGAGDEAVCRISPPADERHAAEEKGLSAADSVTL